MAIVLAVIAIWMALASLFCLVAGPWIKRQARRMDNWYE